MCLARRSPFVSLAAPLLFAACIGRAQGEPAAHAVAPAHHAEETSPATVPDGHGGLYVAFTALPASGNPPILVGHVGFDAFPDAGWTPTPMGNMFTVSDPIHVAVTPGDRVWVEPTWYVSAQTSTYLLRAVGSSGLLAPDPSLAASRDYSFASMLTLGSGRVLVTSKLSPAGGPYRVQLAFVETNGSLTEVATGIVIPGQWGEDPPPVVPDGTGGAWVIPVYLKAVTPFDREIGAIRVTSSGAAANSPACRAVCNTTRDQYEPVAALDGANGVFIAWSDKRDLTKGTDVYVSHLLADGTIGPGIPLLGLAVASLAGEQFQPQMVSDASGGAWLAWTDSRSGENDLYFTHLGTNGLPIASFPAGGRALCAATGSQVSSRLVADGEGGFYAVWLDARDGEIDLYGQHVNAAGDVVPGWVADGLPICTDGTPQGSPAVVLSSPHHALATWRDTRTGYGKMYAALLPDDASTTGVPPGAPARLALAPLANPARDGVELRVSSPGQGPIRVTLVDVGGRVCAEQLLAGPVRGERVRFDAPGAGLFFVRAEQRGALASGRVAVVR